MTLLHLFNMHAHSVYCTLMNLEAYGASNSLRSRYFQNLLVLLYSYSYNHYHHHWDLKIMPRTIHQT